MSIETKSQFVKGYKKYSNIFTTTVGIGMAAPFMKKLLDIPSFSTADVFDMRLHAVPSTE